MDVLLEDQGLSVFQVVTKTLGSLIVVDVEATKIDAPHVVKVIFPPVTTN
jgi:hypothetical protein